MADLVHVKAVHTIIHKDALTGARSTSQPGTVFPLPADEAEKLAHAGAVTIEIQPEPELPLEPPAPKFKRKKAEAVEPIADEPIADEPIADEPIDLLGD